MLAAGSRSVLMLREDLRPHSVVEYHLAVGSAVGAARIGCQLGAPAAAVHSHRTPRRDIHRRGLCFARWVSSRAPSGSALWPSCLLLVCEAATWKCSAQPDLHSFTATNSSPGSGLSCVPTDSPRAHRSTGRKIRLAGATRVRARWTPWGCRGMRTCLRHPRHTQCSLQLPRAANRQFPQHGRSTQGVGGHRQRATVPFLPIRYTTAPCTPAGGARTSRFPMRARVLR